MRPSQGVCTGVAAVADIAMAAADKISKDFIFIGHKDYLDKSN